MSNEFIYGIHAVNALLKNPFRIVQKLYINSDRTDNRIDELLQCAIQKNIAVEKMPLLQMNKHFANYTHQGIVAIAKKLVEYGESDLEALIAAAKKPSLLLILDGITDPHNLGACLRTADATGVDFVVIPKDKNVSITPVVSKVACGAAESIPLVRVTNLVRAMEIIKQAGVWIYGAAGEAIETLYKIDCSQAIALVMGAEGKGMRRLTREHCDGLFSLPMLGNVESLNVSVATGVSLYEVLRQRLYLSC